MTVWVQQPSNLWVNIPFPATMIVDDTPLGNTPYRSFYITSEVKVPSLDPNYKWAMVTDVVLQNHQNFVDNYRGFTRTGFKQYINGTLVGQGSSQSYAGPGYVPTTDPVRSVPPSVGGAYTIHTNMNPSKDGDLTDYIRFVATINTSNFGPTVEIYFNPSGWVPLYPFAYVTPTLMSGGDRPLLRLEVSEGGTYDYAPLFPPPPTCSITQSTLWLVPFLPDDGTATASASPMGILRLGQG